MAGTSLAMTCQIGSLNVSAAFPVAHQKRNSRDFLLSHNFPDALARQTFYDPPERGFEREIRKRLEYWAKLRKERGGE